MQPQAHAPPFLAATPTLVPAGHLLPAPALLPTPRVRKRTAQGLDPIEEASDALALEWGTAPHAHQQQQLGAGALGLGVSIAHDSPGRVQGDEWPRAAKRLRPDVDVEPAFANLSLANASPTRSPASALAAFSPPPPLHAFAPPLHPIPGLVPPPPGLVPPAHLPPKELPVTPPMQQGESHVVPPPLIRTHRPTPTPSPPGPAYADDCRMSSSYDIGPHVVYVASLDDSDDEDDQPPPARDDRRLELHPALLAATAKPPSPLPPELVAPRPEEMGLVLYRPLKFGLEDGHAHADEYRAYERKAAEEERRYDVDDALSVGTGPGELLNVDEDIEMDAMDVDG